MAEKRKFGPSAKELLRKEKKRQEAEKRSRADARRKAELERTGDPRLAATTPPKKVRRGIFPDAPKTSAAVSVKPESAEEGMKGAGKRRAEEAEKKSKTKRRRR